MSEFKVYASKEEIALFKAYAAACDRSLSNFAVHAMRSCMRRNKKKLPPAASLKDPEFAVKLEDVREFYD